MNKKWINGSHNKSVGAALIIMITTEKCLENYRELYFALVPINITVFYKINIKSVAKCMIWNNTDTRRDNN
jgi:hypothetical protein